MSNIYEELKRADIPMPAKSTETFQMIRWGRNNRYWLRKFEGGYVFGDFVTGLQSHCFDKDFRGRYLESARQKMFEAMQLVEDRTRKIHDASATRALILWSNAKPVGQNRYLKAKQVRNYNLKEHNGHLLLPLIDNTGKIWSLQFINDVGEKKFLSGGRKKGCYFVIGEIEKAERICICEGYATGASIYESTGIPVIVAFDAGNLEDVAKAIRAKENEVEIIICADNDCYHESGINPGLEKAKKAAELIGARVVFPTFKDTSTNPTDFNDLFIQEGAEAVKAIIEAVNCETNTAADAEEREKKEAIENVYTNNFKLTDKGLFWEDERLKKIVKISDYIRVVAFTKSSSGVAKLVEFRDYKGELKQIILKSQMLAKDGEQTRIALINQGFTYAGSLFSKRKLFEYISSSCPKNELLLLSRTGFFDTTYVRPDCVIGETEPEHYFGSERAG